MGARREHVSEERGWAGFARVGRVALWGWRFYEQQSAAELALGGDYGGAQVVRVGVNAYPVTPVPMVSMRVVETPQPFYRRVWVE